jgi:hypothetical protein
MRAYEHVIWMETMLCGCHGVVGQKQGEADVVPVPLSDCRDTPQRPFAAAKGFGR